MKTIYNNKKEIIDLDKLNLLSNIGSEVVVYNDEKLVYKIFKDNYSFEHKDESSLNLLSSINTSRILMPISLLYEDDKLVGYTMQYIIQGINILEDTLDNLLNELLIIEEDIKRISKLGIRLIDINPSNTIYNGNLYLVDPGNYYINDVNDLLVYYENTELTEEDKEKIILEWNYEKINKLLHQLLFMNNSDIDFYMLRKIIEFFNNEKKKNNSSFELKIYEQYFDKNLKIRDSINKFIKENIVVDEEEKKKILNLFCRK